MRTACSIRNSCRARSPTSNWWSARQWWAVSCARDFARRISPASGTRARSIIFAELTEPRRFRTPPIPDSSGTPELPTSACDLAHLAQHVEHCAGAGRAREPEIEFDRTLDDPVAVVVGEHQE